MLTAVDGVGHWDGAVRRGERVVAAVACCGGVGRAVKGGESCGGDGLLGMGR